ncbi:hypothetical protein SDC9_65587 [bioreactor metagenome]|uniref:Uncharacterized protein n=1 Tax=bioreactor metagenome TaxID=1076179 RepID=A0A644XSW3_9ZZZZ
MGVLRARLHLIVPGLGRIVILAVTAHDKLPGCVQRFFGESERVGSHVGDKADGPLSCDVNALVELGGNRHSPLRGHVKLARGFLLEGAGDKGRSGRPILVLTLYVGNSEGRTADETDNLIHRSAVFEFFFLSVRIELSLEFAPVGRDTAQIGLKRPILLRLEFAYFFFPFGDQAGRHRLYTAGGKAAADLLPEKR